MLIDWFTVVAQALNFLILVWLMRRYLYRPILNAIDARESLVASQLSEADAKMLEARSQLETFNEKNQEFEAQRRAMLAEAAGEAKREGARIIADAQASANALLTQTAASLERKNSDLTEDLKRRTCEQVLAISRRALSDLAGADLEQRIVDMLDLKLRALSDGEKSRLREQFSADGSEVVVSTAFELPAKQREAIRSLLSEVLGISGPIRYGVSPKLVSGIELSAPGTKIAWSIDEYLRTLDQRVGEILDVR